MKPDGRFRFENFVVGSANRLAVAAARAVAEAPGSAYNPLFIYSASGLGKTHLAGAMGHLARQLQPTLNVEYVTLDEFVEQLHAAISIGQTSSFTQRYQHVAMLIIDDVQFLTGRRETQSEMLRLFNALQGSGRQIVMTSDRPPAEIKDVDERLVTRLAGGLIVDIGPPDYETRVAILRNKCEERDVELRPRVIEELAQIEFTNVRELQGALNRVIAQQQLGGPVKTDQVRIVLGEPAPAWRAPTPAKERGGEYLSFLSEVTSVVERNVEAWRLRVGEAIAYWSGEGYRTAVLEKALSLKKQPDIEGLLRMYSAAIERLRALEAQATALDPAVGASDVFRDPESVKAAEDLVRRAKMGELPPPGPSAAFSRAGFEVGPSNLLAVKAADAVAQEPGSRYNPLFLHGPSGVGKTHLVNAIGNEIIEASGGAISVSFVTSQAFIDELIEALQDGSLERWRNRYRSAGALIIDDVQFMAGKERTQEELFHVFNALYKEGKQIIFTSDREPKELDGLEDRLRSRFEGGLVAEIQPPDRALREKLYARYLSLVEPQPDDDLLPYLSDRPAASVREIIGTVNRLVAAADVAGVPLGMELARTELEGVGSAPAHAPANARAVDAFFLDDEKVVWDWPDVSGRAIEEWR